MTSINGLGTALNGLGQAGLDGRAPTKSTRDPDRAAAPAAASPAGEMAASTPESLMGVVDPQLWVLLSSEERAYYMRNVMTGPLTYGPGTAPDAQASSASRLGGRIDVRG